MGKRRLLRELQGGKVVYRWLGEPTLPLKLRLLPWVNALLLTGAATSVVAVTGLALQVLLNPDAGFWLQQVATRPTNQTTLDLETAPQTLEQIQVGLQAQGKNLAPTNFLTPSGALTLNFQQANTLLIPVLAPTSPTNPTGTALQEIRLYQTLDIPAPLSWWQNQKFFRLQQKLILRGPTASQVLAATYDPRLSGIGSNSPLPLSQFLPYANPIGGDGQWFSVGGSLSQGSLTSTYGALLYFDPNQVRLQQQLVWNSPQGGSPQWQEITGAGQPELVVNRGVGLEPDFQIYQLEATERGIPKLQLLSLERPVLAHPRYQAGLKLAKAGLWAQALAELEPIQAELKRAPLALAQLDIIRYHAQITQAQAQQATASPSDRIIGLLINGSWESALQTLEQNLDNGSEIRAYLQQDSGKLQRRLEATLVTHPQQPAAMAWMALLLNSQQGQTEAKAWLGKRVASGTQVYKRIEKLLGKA